MGNGWKNGVSVLQTIEESENFSNNHYFNDAEDMRDMMNINNMKVLSQIQEDGKFNNSILNSLPQNSNFGERFAIAVLLLILCIKL